MTSSNTRVLVTGASGYIASHVVQQLQRQGYQVRGTVRSVKNEAKCKPLRQLCPDARVPVELVEADLMDEACWPKVVEGCQYVMHMASPFPASNVVNEDEIIKPAVNGTLNVLKACVAVKGVKRVVLTSSVAAVSGGFDTGGDYDESNWTDAQKPKLNSYLKSKTLAEKAGWDYLESLDQADKFELAVVNPAFVMGPVLIDTMTTSMEMPKRLLERAMPMLPKLNWAIVDVRDCATAHLQAMVLPEAAGKRHIAATFNMNLEDLAKTYEEEFKPQGYDVPTRMAPNCLMSFMALFDGSVKMMVPSLNKVTRYDNSRFTKVLGVTPIDSKRTLLEMAYSMIERGMIKKTAKYRGPPAGTKF